MGPHTPIWLCKSYMVCFDLNIHNIKTSIAGLMGHFRGHLAISGNQSSRHILGVLDSLDTLQMTVESFCNQIYYPKSTGSQIRRVNVG